MLGATLFDAIFGRVTTPVGNVDGCYRIWDAEGPLSAFEAYDIAERYALGVEVDAFCTNIASIAPLASTGRADGWELTFDMPLRRGEARYRVTTRRDERGEIVPGIEVDETITPHSERGIPPRSVSALPIPFRDTTCFEAFDVTAGAALCRSEVNETGEIIWRLTLKDASTITMPLAA